MDKYIPYQESYPNLEKALRDGAKIHVSSSGGGLRVVRVENEKNELLSYGEYPYFSGALAHAESDFGLSYKEQYSGKNAKHTHYLTGSYALPDDILDLYVHSKGAKNAFDVVYSKKCDKIICTRPSYNSKKIICGSGQTLFSAIAMCLANCTSYENEESFLEQYDI